MFPQERGFSIGQRSLSCAVCDAHGARGVYQNRPCLRVVVTLVPCTQKGWYRRLGSVLRPNPAVAVSVSFLSAER